MNKNFHDLYTSHQGETTPVQNSNIGNNQKETISNEQIQNFEEPKWNYDLSINKLEELSTKLLEKDRQITELIQNNFSKELLLSQQYTQILNLYNSRTWKIGSILWNPVCAMFPTGSVQRNILSDLKRVIRTIRKYFKWIERNEPKERDLRQQRVNSALFAYQPIISIVVPIFNTPIKVLKEALDSVIIQTYPKWELCIANGSPNNQEVNTVLREYANKDDRILLKHLKTNEGIAGNTNAAISMATGEFVAFLDHDDTLAPFALYSIVEEINNHPQCDLLYSDEDFLTENGMLRYDPVFKFAYSPDYLRTNNYFCHFLVVRKKLGDSIGWIRKGYEGAQDFDFVLRCTEKTNHISHIPAILYHWRTIEGSTAKSIQSKGYASLSGLNAVQSHINRMNLSGTVFPGVFPTIYRIEYALSYNPLVTLIIPILGKIREVKNYIKSILEKTTYNRIEIILIEFENSLDNVDKEIYTTLLKNKSVSLHFFEKSHEISQVYHQATSLAKGDVFIFLLPEIEVIQADWIEKILQYAQRSDIGIVAPKITNVNNRITNSGIMLDKTSLYTLLNPLKSEWTMDLLIQNVHNVSAVSNECFAVRKSVFDIIGGIDPKTGQLFSIDLSLASRKAGLLNLWTPHSSLLLHNQKGINIKEDQNSELVQGSEAYFRSKWEKVLQDKDFYFRNSL